MITNKVKQATIEYCAKNGESANAGEFELHNRFEYDTLTN